MGIHAGFRKNPGRLIWPLLKPMNLPSSGNLHAKCVLRRASNGFQRASWRIQNFYGLAKAVIVTAPLRERGNGQRGIADAERTCQIVADAVGCCR